MLQDQAQALNCFIHFVSSDLMTWLGDFLFNFAPLSPHNFLGNLWCSQVNEYNLPDFPDVILICTVKDVVVRNIIYKMYT